MSNPQAIHWTLCIIQMQERRCIFYCPYGKRPNDYNLELWDRVKEYLTHEYESKVSRYKKRHQHRDALAFERWTFHPKFEYGPVQPRNDTTNCGVFVCITADYFLLRKVRVRHRY